MLPTHGGRREHAAICGKSIAGDMVMTLARQIDGVIDVALAMMMLFASWPATGRWHVVGNLSHEEVNRRDEEASRAIFDDMTRDDKRGQLAPRRRRRPPMISLHHLTPIAESAGRATVARHHDA